MPRTSHCLSDDETLGERAVIVGAVRTHGEQLIALSHEEHLLAVDAPEDLVAVWKTPQSESVSEIGFCSLLRVCHRSLMVER
ncbi:MAG TPA: hypothetical protein VF332_10700 [Vicinamibacterales bacterium]